MKTLHITNAWHSNSGGVSTFYRALLAAAESRGQEMVLVVPGEEDRVEAQGSYGRIYFMRAPKAPFNRDYRLIMPQRFLLRRGAVNQILQHEQPGLVEVCDKYTMHYLAGLLRLGALPGADFRPAVVGLSCERFDEQVAVYLGGAGRLARWLSRAYMKWLYFPLFDHHITVSPHTSGELLAASRGHKVTRGVWIRPMGVDLSVLSPARRSQEKRAALAARAGGGAGSRLVLYAGRLAPEKNLGLLLDAMSALKHAGSGDYRLIVAGAGPLMLPLQSRAAELGLAAAFLGHIQDKNELADLLANCDVFVHTNPREPFGIAPLEAMASGLPLVGPETGGVRVYAHPDNAWLAPNDAVAYADAIRAATAGDGDTRLRKVAAARATAERYSWVTVCAGFLDLYAELHDLVKGTRSVPALRPDFESTPGNLIGLELNRHGGAA